MRSIALILSEQIPLDTITQELDHLGKIGKYNDSVAVGEELTLETSESHVFIYYDEYIPSECEPEELEFIKSIYPNPLFLDVCTYDNDLAWKVVTELSKKHDFRILNDGDWIATYKEYAEIVPTAVDWVIFHPDQQKQ
jgi:hypothetical protein